MNTENSSFMLVLPHKLDMNPYLEKIIKIIFNQFPIYQESPGLFLFDLFVILSLIPFLFHIVDVLRAIYQSDRSNVAIYDILEGHEPRAKYACLKGCFYFLSIFMWVHSLLFVPYLQQLVRLRPIPCSHCSHRMKRLRKRDKKRHLSKEEALEDSMDSVRHDVWFCAPCKKYEVFTYINRRSDTSKCTSCGRQTVEEINRVVTREATQWEKGEGLVEYTCRNCGHNYMSKYEIPCTEEDRD